MKKSIGKEKTPHGNILKKTIKAFEKSDKPAKLSMSEYQLLADFDNLIILVEAILSNVNEINEAEEKSLIYLLEHGLYQYQIDIGNELITERDFSLIQCIESRIARKISEIDSEGFNLIRNIVSALFNASMPVSESLLNSLNEAEYGNNSNNFPDEQFELTDLFKHFEEVLDVIDAESDYDVYLGVAEQLNQLPDDATGLMMLTLLKAKHHLARDAALLLILHPLARVREQVLNHLLPLARQGLLNDKDYQRLTVIRNWMGKAEKKIIDKTIKYLQRNPLVQQSKSIQKTFIIHDIHSSSIDNSGCIAIQIVFKIARKYMMIGLVLKQGVGITDAFVSDKMSKTDYVQTLEKLNEEMPVISISATQLNILLKHFLQNNLSQAQVPPVELLLLKEFSGIQCQHPQPITIEEVNTLLSGSKTQHKPKIDAEEFIFGWASPEYAANHKNEDALITHEFEPLRNTWLERLLLTVASFAFELDDVELFFDAAKQIEAGKKLTSIELFQRIAFVILNDDMFLEGDGDIEQLLLQKMLEEGGRVFT